ncbi:hypothetical protein PR048_005106 [Dryococelus australis]|uniref:Ribosomal protein S7 n=1 Tax=Dryococelus australis TaxID=614101 RepID=A0ABQ9I8F0_9NEOP|nr:hypothetical protein PR048_005106 [Dryococelus australis]
MKTTLLTSAKLLQPELIKGVCQNLAACFKTVIEQFNKNGQQHTPLKTAQNILYRVRHKQWVPAKVSYIIYAYRALTEEFMVSQAIRIPVHSAIGIHRIPKKSSRSFARNAEPRTPLCGKPQKNFKKHLSRLQRVQ